MHVKLSAKKARHATTGLSLMAEQLQIDTGVNFGRLKQILRRALLGLPQDQRIAQLLQFQKYMSMAVMKRVPSFRANCLDGSI
mmetsp:Transcript_21232/g.41643  ORF Transcript_21232/g.41643 Transcript_21232/m.41643 type:complete len:83 (-) Transcript_21232:2396-2644(-)